MKDMKTIRWAGALTLAPALLALACGGSGNGVSGPTPNNSAPVDVAGSWVGTWRMDVEEEPELGPAFPRRGGSVRLSLLQFGSAVTGAAEFTGLFGSSSSADCLEKASIAGRVAADLISLTLTNGTAGSEGSLQGQVQGNALNGSFASACIHSATLALTRE